MGYVENELQEQALERMNEMLSDALSLVILLENDMEIQKSDGVYARILRMIHENMKGAKKRAVRIYAAGKEITDRTGMLA